MKVEPLQDRVLIKRVEEHQRGDAGRSRRLPSLSTVAVDSEWAALIVSIKPNEDFVAAQARACTVLGVSGDPLLAAQKEVEQLPAASPLLALIKAQGWVPPQPSE